MKIKTTYDIWNKGCIIKSDNYNEWNIKWVTTSKIKERINNIRDVIRECSFEDEFGEQCFKFCDLNNMFKLLEEELSEEGK